jgi:3-deoxy-D-manno-octulosonic-acid transferase
MLNHYDIAYGLGVGLAAPFWLSRTSTRRKVLAAFSQRMGRVPERDRSSPAIMIHAVSLGEINATRSLVDLLRTQRPGLHFIVSVTTETGFNRGKELYGSVPDVTLVRYPLDFSSAIDRLLDALRPSVVALLELEVWPNFIRRCGRRGVPVVLVNGRITDASYRKYKLARPLVGSMFSRLRHVCAQDQTYADRFVELGVSAQRISVTGTMKFDNASLADSVPGQDELSAACGLQTASNPIWVCGSTGPGEEALILVIYDDLLKEFPKLRLAIIPRKPERFDEVAALIQSAGFGLFRRSNSQSIPSESLPQIVLGDTMGELRKFYSLADVVFVGRTLVDLGARQHGSDMIEPAALGKPVIVGPFTGNFTEAMNRFLEANSMLVVQNAAELTDAISLMLRDPRQAREMGIRARDVVKHGQGATQKHAQLILETLDSLSAASIGGSMNNKAHG